MLIDFQNSFTYGLTGKFAIKSLLDILMHLKCIATIPCEIRVQKFAILE